MKINAVGKLRETNEKIRAIGPEGQYGDSQNGSASNKNDPFTQKVEILDGARKGTVIRVNVNELVED